MKSRYLALLFLLVACRHREVTLREQPVKKPRVASAPAPAKRRDEGYAAMRETLGVSNKQISNNPLYSFVCEWYGAPYRYSGCQRTGVDCSCFSNILYEKVYNKKIPRSATEMYSACHKIGLEDAREGDLVFFKIGGNVISHVGVLLKSKFFVHSSTSRGVTISSFSEAYYKKYFFCAGRIRNA
jgi:cell wall-associated NlpC family hydrolase